MYSPKIREDLIPRIYRAAKEARLHMTTWVSQAVEKSLPDAPITNRNITERIAVMKTAETSQPVNRLAETPLVIVKGESGYRVCSPLMPAKQYVVSGIPDDPMCTCEDFMHPDCPPGWVCEHIQAVLKEVSRLEPAAPAEATAPVPHQDGNGHSAEPPSHNGKNGNGKPPKGRNGKGLVMLLKRSVSPDGRIDSLSIEFSSPVASVTAHGLKELAQSILALQNEIADVFLKSNGRPAPPASSNGDKPHANNGQHAVTAPANAVPAALVGISSMKTRRGHSLYLSVLAQDRMLKVFGNQKQLGEMLSAAGYPALTSRLVDGFALNLPCRVVTRQNGRYLDVQRVYPPENVVPVGA